CPVGRPGVPPRRLCFLVGQLLGQVDHRIRVRLPWISAASHAVSKVLDLSNEISHRQTRWWRVLRPSLAVRKMTGSASARRFPESGGTMRNDGWHPRVSAGAAAA